MSSATMPNWILTIWEFIAQDNLDAADRWIDKLFEAFETLGRTPRLGRIREELASHPVRFCL